MKSENLRILKEHGIRVPEFITVYEGEGIDLSFSDAGRFAVRSSFYLEDRSERSWAGQFTTLLNVERACVAEAVETVRESYARGGEPPKPAGSQSRKPPKPAGGRGQEPPKPAGSQGGKPLKPAGSQSRKQPKPAGSAHRSPVIIQEMVLADWSGVMFTVNPMGIWNELVITAGCGLGNRVVEDRAETVTYYYNYDDKQFYLKEASAVSLPERILKGLAAYAGKIRAIFGREMDIEFAVKDGEIFILQARPITAMETGKVIVLDNSNIVESYPGVSLPATLDFVHDIYRDIFRSCVLRVTGSRGLTGEMDDIFEHMVADYNGAVYYQITNWYEILRLLPCSDRIIRIWQEMLGVDNRTAAGGRIRVSAWMKCRIVFSFIHYLIMTPVYMDRLGRYFDAIYPKFQKKIAAEDSVEGLLRLYRRLERSITGVWDITLINDMYTFIFTALCGGKENRRISDIRNIESMKPVEARKKLREAARLHGTDSRIYQELEQAYIAQFGDRVLGELKLETKTYRTDPGMLREEILREAEAGPELTHGSAETGPELLCENAEAGPELIRGSAETGKRGGPGLICGRVERGTGSRLTRGRAVAGRRGSPDLAGGPQKMSPLLRAARCGIAGREKSRLNRSRLFGMAREILLKAGTILARDGRLDVREDVFYLYFDEIASGGCCQELVRARKEQFAAYGRLPHPRRLVFRGSIREEQRLNLNESYEGITEIFGTGTSPGRVTAEALVVSEAVPGTDAAGKILVTRSTDPGWVFLLEHCAGIIAERGSLLSHTAIISRELGKPAVVNVKDAARIIRSGDLVEIIADRGLVRILKRS